MDERTRLVANCPDQLGMAMSKTAYRNASQGVKIALAFFVP